MRIGKNDELFLSATRISLIKVFPAVLWVLSLASFTFADKTSIVWAEQTEVQSNTTGTGQKKEVFILDAITEATTRYMPLIFKEHELHIRLAGNDCRRCHHKQKGENTCRKCSSCHGMHDASLNMKEAMHKTCVGCHRETLQKNPGVNAPIRCLDCHTERK